MTSKQIEYFLTVADCLNFTLAGKQLYASQPTISRQINLLEEEFGFELFDRKNNQVRLTAAGSLMYPVLQQMQTAFYEQLKIARAVSLGKNGSISIGMLTNMDLDLFLTPLIESFTKKYPNIELTFSCYPSANFLSAFERNEIDLAIIHAFDLPETDYYDSKKIHETNIQVLYSSKHPLSEKRGLTLKDFEGEPYITTNRVISDKFKRMLQNIADHYKMPEFPIMTYEYFDSVQLNVRLGNGFAFVDPLVFGLTKKDGFCLLELDDEIPPVSIYASWVKDNKNPAIPLLLDFIAI